MECELINLYMYVKLQVVLTMLHWKVMNSDSLPPQSNFVFCSLYKMKTHLFSETYNIHVTLLFTLKSNMASMSLPSLKIVPT